ncbi:MAG TPA: PepSY domain-containing protein [Sphingomicrobium sp.]|nr:PepSY domain-containing protein [Sphingomicrobium sp.]
MRKIALFALIAVVAAPAIAKGKDPRPPSPEQQVQIERALKEQGYVRWSGIRTDDDGPEVDSAWDAQGRRYELKLHPATLRVIRRERED